MKQLDPAEDYPRSPTEEKKSGNAGHITIRVVDMDSREVLFKIKHTTPFNKLMDAYSKLEGKSLDTLRFLYDGSRIKGNNTPEGLEMQDEDIIHVMIQQL